MDLRDGNWKAYGRCVITEYTLGNNKTKGKYVPVRIFGKKQGKHATDAFVPDDEVEDILSRIN